MVGHTREHKPLSTWIVLPIVGVLAALSILSSIHGRLPAVDSRAENSGAALAPDARDHAGVAAVNPAAVPDELPATAPAEPGSAQPPVSAARVQRAQDDGSPPAAGNISLPERTYRVQPRQNFAEVRVRRAAKSTGDVRFSWWTEPASAGAGTDFVPQAPVTATFGKGIRTASLFVKVLPNESRSRSEVFYVDVSDLSGAGPAPRVARVAVVLPTAH
jgi:hypothetical protein